SSTEYDRRPPPGRCSRPRSRPRTPPPRAARAADSCARSPRRCALQTSARAAMRNSSGRRPHFRQHLGDGLDRAGDAALAELSHAADPERLYRGELAWIQDIAVRLDGIVEILEDVAGALGREERDDDRRLNGRGQKALESEPRHAFDQGAAVPGVAGAARREPALLEVLRDRRIERRHHVRRRRVAPLSSFLHVDPLVIQVERERMAVFLAALERLAPRDDEAHAGRTLETLPGGGYQGVERRGSCVDLERTEGAHRVDDQAPPMAGDDLGNLLERVQDPGAGLAVHQRHVRDRGIRAQRALDAGGGDLRVLSVIDGRELAAEHAAYSGDALTISPVLRHQNVSGARHQRADGRLDREGAAALHRNALVRPAAVNDLEQTLADPPGDAVEVDIPGSPVAQHALPRAQRGRQG